MVTAKNDPGSGIPDIQNPTSRQYRRRYHKEISRGRIGPRSLLDPCSLVDTGSAVHRIDNRADKSRPTPYRPPKSFSCNPKPSFHDEMAVLPSKPRYCVATPYGPGVQKSIATNGMNEIQLQGWSAKLYTPTSFPSVPATVGCDVVCLFGRGCVEQVREDCLVVLLSSWRLAGRSRVRLYLQPSRVQVVQALQIPEMSVVERIEHANRLKEKAAQAFRGSDYQSALQQYQSAMEAVRFVQHDRYSSNLVRADLLVVMVTCANNAGTCSLKLSDYAQAVESATRALDLLHAMEQKRGHRIHGELNKNGYSDTKLFGEWTTKSKLIIANGLLQQGNVEQALTVLGTALETVRAHELTRVLVNHEKEVLRLTAKCKDRRKAQRKKEKQRAIAMFANTEKDAPTVSAPATRENSSVAVHDATEAVDSETSIPNGATKTLEPLAPSPKSVTFNRQQPNPQDDTVDRSAKKRAAPKWYDDPQVLGGICISVGVVGMALLLSQAYWPSKR